MSKHTGTMLDGLNAELSCWDSFRSALASIEVELPQEAEVHAYLEAHFDMHGLTIEICKAARREFSLPAQLSLRVCRDVEIDDSCLTLLVRLSCYRPDALSRFRSICDPFDYELAHASGAILVTTDFVSIR
jgi:hypothetical protein